MNSSLEAFEVNNLFFLHFLNLILEISASENEQEMDFSTFLNFGICFVNGKRKAVTTFDVLCQEEKISLRSESLVVIEVLFVAAVLFVQDIFFCKKLIVVQW